MAQSLEQWLHKPDDPSLIPGSHVKVQGENKVHKVKKLTLATSTGEMAQWLKGLAMTEI